MPQFNGKRAGIVFTLLAFLVILLFVTDLLFGPVQISMSEIFKILFTGSSNYPEWEIIVLNFRLPKAIAAILCGIALSISGLQMQAIFRNPLAGPDVLGINSGAGLGVALVVLSMSGVFTQGLAGISGNWLIAIAACTGAAGVLMVIMAVSARIKDIMSILIIGIMIGTGFSAITGILQFFGNEVLLKSFVVWTMGSLTHVSWPQLMVMGLLLLLGTIISIFCIKRLNLLLLGEKYAQSMGMNVKTTRLLVFASTSLLAGAVTAFCGPIAFVAIAVPHLCRIMLRTSDHKQLWLACILAGASIMLFSDIMAQLPGSAFTLPINSITSLIGIPIVIWIVASNRKQKIF